MHLTPEVIEEELKRARGLGWTKYNVEALEHALWSQVVVQRVEHLLRSSDGPGSPTTPTSGTSGETGVSHTNACGAAT